MAKVNGPFILSGKVGDHVYYQRKGKQLVRRKPAPRKTGPSVGQLVARVQIWFYDKFFTAVKVPFRGDI